MGIDYAKRKEGQRGVPYHVDSFSPLEEVEKMVENLRYRLTRTHSVHEAVSEKLEKYRKEAVKNAEW